MAKKRREKDEEEPEFKLPKFDEKTFIQKERRNLKTLYLSFGTGLLIAIVSFSLWVLLYENQPYFAWSLILLFGVVNAVWLRYLFQRFNVDIPSLGRKEWFVSYAIYFFSWLLVLIILVNPPFYDAEAPFVQAVTLPGVQEPGGTILFAAQITDNVGITSDDIQFMITDPNGNTSTPSFTYSNNTLTYEFTNPENLMGTFTYSLVVTDVNGRVNDTHANRTFTYDEDALRITSSVFTNLRSGDKLTINADPDICTNNFLVYYSINNSDPINVNRADVSAKDEYTTSPEYEGWVVESNLTMTIYAEASHYFVNNPTKYSNTVMDTTTYNVSTGYDGDTGSETPPREWNCTRALFQQEQADNTINYSLPCPVFVATPGFELLVFLAAFLVVVLLVKRRKKP